MKKNESGFTLIELLAVIVILGLLMAIAIPSVTKYITESRKKTLTTTIENYMSALTTDVNNLEYVFTETNTIYAVPIECVKLDRGGTNPFGEWYQANDVYWAYILIQYNDNTSSYAYGFTFKDSAGYGMYPTTIKKINENGKQIITGLDLKKPSSGLATYFISKDKWNGFDIKDDTELKVLLSRNNGDNYNTCTIMQKGNNYEAIEETLKKTGTLINSGDTKNSVFGKSMSKSLIEEINTQNYIDVPSYAVEVWDASNQQNGSIMAWTLDINKNGLYELYLAQEGNVKITSAKYLFSYYDNVKKYDLKYVDTSSTNDMGRMFYYNSKLTNIDLSSFNTSNVKYLNHFFMGCTSLENANLSYFNTTKISEMNHIFQNCTSLKYIDIRNIDYENIKALINHDSFSGVPNNARVIVKNDNVKEWIKNNINSSLNNIITIDEL